MLVSINTFDALEHVRYRTATSSIILFVTLYPALSPLLNACALYTASLSRTLTLSFVNASLGRSLVVIEIVFPRPLRYPLYLPFVVPELTGRDGEGRA